MCGAARAWPSLVSARAAATHRVRVPVSHVFFRAYAHTLRVITTQPPGAHIPLLSVCATKSWMRRESARARERVRERESKSKKGICKQGISCAWRHLLNFRVKSNEAILRVHNGSGHTVELGPCCARFFQCARHVARHVSHAQKNLSRRDSRPCARFIQCAPGFLTATNVELFVQRFA